MSAQVERLQSLLHRVQRNRERPRLAGEGPTTAAAPEVEAEAAFPDTEPPTASIARPTEPPISLVPEPVSDPPGLDDAFTSMPAPAPRPTAPPSPAVPKLDSPARPSPPAPRRPEAASPLMAAFDNTLNQTEPPAPLAQGAPPAVDSEPRDVPLEPAREPSKPVVQVISPPPAVEEVTFGELLNRSLALRPR